MKAHPIVSLCLFSALLLQSSACQTQPPPPADNRAADEAAIRALEEEWWKSGVAKDVEKFVSYYAPDASVYPPNAALTRGREEIRKLFAGMMSSPGFAIQGRSLKAEAARSGDLAWETGTFELTMNDAKSKPTTSSGKYVVVWRKQPNGEWKAVADIFNTDK